MKVECVKQNLGNALLIAERFTGKQLSLPVLRYVLFIADQKSLKLRATNLDIGIEIEIPAKVEREGVIAIPADTLGSFLANLSREKNVTIEQVGSHLTLSGSSYSTLIKGFGYEDFPTLPFVTNGVTFSIEITQLLNAFRSTEFAVATTDIKPEFSSVHMFYDDQTLIFVASNSSRLAEKRIPLKKSIEQCSLLIPGKNVVEIIRALEHLGGSVNLSITKNQLTLRAEHITITTRLVDGMFPDYRQLIAKKFQTEIILLKQDFIDALKLTTVFGGKLQQVRLKAYPSEKIFEVEAKSDEIGETTQQIESTLKGDDVELLLNQRFLSDALSRLEGDSIELLANGPGKPIIIRAVGDHTFTYLVMPMKG